MKIQHNNLSKKKWLNSFDLTLDSKNTVILIFSQLTILEIQPYIDKIANDYPLSLITGCSTAGQILNGKLLDSKILVTVVKFDKSRLEYFSCKIEESHESFTKGMELAQKFSSTPTINNILIFSKGHKINGSQLIDGINTVIDEGTLISGGLAGDDDRFEKTWIINQDKQACDNCIAGLAIFGDKINSNSASQGGWDMIGIDRKVTKSNDNILYELNHKPALEIYKQYLGEYSNNLPSSGLLFPLAIIDKYDHRLNKVRTILEVDHDENSITFAGDIPTGSMVRLMHANFDRLIDGASNAGNQLIIDKSQINQECLCISISCVGRKLILGQRVEEEIEAVQANIPEQCIQIGFYSYGELSPLANGSCDLHNQTMTLTLLWED